MECLRIAFVEPGSGHGAGELLERPRVARAGFREREDRLGVDGHLRLGTLEPEPVEDLLVVDDDAVVDSDHGAVADRMVVGLDCRVALRVIAHVDEHVTGSRGNDDRLEQLAGAGLLLVHRDAGRARSVRVPDGVGAALGDPGEKRLRGQRARRLRFRPEAISRYAAHAAISSFPSDVFDAIEPPKLDWTM